jgi:hypothetical protein
MPLNGSPYPLAEDVFDFAPDQEDDFAKASSDRIIDRVIDQDFAFRPDRLDLLEPTIAMPNAACHND